VLDVQHESFAGGDYLALLRRHGVGSVITDSLAHGAFADLSGELVYLQLRNTAAHQPQGYAEPELVQWAERAIRWARGDEPEDLPRLQPAGPADRPRDVFVLFINGAKLRNPAAAMALLKALERQSSSAGLAGRVGLGPTTKGS